MSAPFLTSPYAAYWHRAIPKEDKELTHVGPGTPCGEYLRRFWQPVAHSSDLKDLPRALKIMGEELVIFRDLSSTVGLLHRHCSHRGASLEYGRISERGIRCCYHSWLFDVDGKILETPGEPAKSTLKERLFHGAYPTLEYNGLVFAYMGRPDRKPAFPVYDSLELPGYRHVPAKDNFMPCNWLQIKENSMDPVHTAFLHTIVSGDQFTSAFGDVGTIDWKETPIGMVYIHTRRAGDVIWVRMNDFILPNIHQVPPVWEEAKEEKIFQRPMMTHWSVPIDDTLTMNIGFRHINEKEHVDPQKALSVFGQTGDRPHEERQRQPGDYDAQISQRPIAIHALEHLATTDRGIILFRKMLREAIRATQKGEDPKGLIRRPGRTIPTYSNDTIVAIPPASNPELDQRLLRIAGQTVAENDLRRLLPLSCDQLRKEVLARWRKEPGYGC